MTRDYLWMPVDLVLGRPTCTPDECYQQMVFRMLQVLIKHNVTADDLVTKKCVDFDMRMKRTGSYPIYVPTTLVEDEE